MSMKYFVTFFLAVLGPAVVAGELFQSDSKRLGNPKMDIVLTERERLPRLSVVDIHIKAIGSSVGSSFFILCSLRNLARERGHFRYIAKAENKPGRNQMLVGFLDSADDSPAKIDPRLAGQTVIDLGQFDPICDRMK